MLSIFVMKLDSKNVDIAAKEGAAVIVDDRYHHFCDGVHT
jgi:predicted oxidoreductase